MKKSFLVFAVLVLSVFLVSGCGTKANSSDPLSTERQDKNGTAKPVTLATFSPYFYKSDAKGMSLIQLNRDFSTWIQLSPTENVRVYVELFLEEKGTFSLSYYEMQVGISDAAVLNEQKIKGTWKLSGDKLLLSDVATLSQKSVNNAMQLTIGFLKDVQTAGLKDKQTILVGESRVYAAVE